MMTGIIVSGVFSGLIYALLAINVVILYKATKILNFAQMGIALLAAYMSWYFLDQLNMPLWLFIPALVALGALVGFAIQYLTIGPIMRQPLLSLIMMTIGVSVIMQALPVAFWGGGQKAIPSLGLLPGIEMAGLLISEEYLLIAIICLVLIGFLVAFFRWTRLGLDMRGVAEDVSAAEGLGVSLRRVFTSAWVMATVITVVVGFSLGSLLTVTTEITGYALKAFCVAILGGLESIPGAIVAGILIGIIENLAVVYINPLVGGAASEVAAYVVLLVILLVKAEGLFGLKRIERV